MCLRFLYFVCKMRNNGHASKVRCDIYNVRQIPFQEHNIYCQDHALSFPEIKIAWAIIQQGGKSHETKKPCEIEQHDIRQERWYLQIQVQPLSYLPAAIRWFYAHWNQSIFVTSISRQFLNTLPREDKKEIRSFTAVQDIDFKNLTRDTIEEQTVSKPECGKRLFTSIRCF